MNDVNFIKSSLTLHNAVPVVKKSLYNKKLFRYGYIAPEEISETVENILINSAIKLNCTFYNTWNDITSKKHEDILVDQIYHYISVEISDILKYPEIIYIPNISENGLFPLRLIKGLTCDEIKDLTRGLIYKNVALKESTIEDAFNILHPTEVDITRVKNRDSRTYIFVNHGITPNESIDILRCAVYDITGDLTLIKNKNMYYKIEKGKNIVKWLSGNEEKLSCIFNRFKPIFMSMKTHDEAKHYINKISKLSKKHHTPLKTKNEPSTGYEIVRHLKYLLENKKPKVYQVRTGKMWCTRDRKHEIEKYTAKLKEILPESFVQSPGTRLTIPTSEKNFSGSFPIGTRFGLSSDAPMNDALIIGIHWKNQDGSRIDLDLCAVDMKGKIGWNTDYYTDKYDVIYSGDVTDATSGANEYLYFKGVNRPKVVLVNKYKTGHEGDVDISIIVAANGQSPSKNEIIDDRKVIATINTTCDENQKTLGIVYPTNNGPTFILIDKCVGKKITVGSMSEDSEIMIDAFMDNYLYMDEYITPSETHDINLSNNMISKSVILDIFNKKC
jgi:hypothetical protein